VHTAHTHSDPSHVQHSLLHALKYLPFAILAPVALYEHSTTLLLLGAVGLLMVLVFAERVDRIAPARRDASAGASRAFGDGGSFPGRQAERRPHRQSRGAVIDGGSLEHHRH